MRDVDLLELKYSRYSTSSTSKRLPEYNSAGCKPVSKMYLTYVVRGAHCHSHLALSRCAILAELETNNIKETSISRRKGKNMIFFFIFTWRRSSSFPSGAVSMRHHVIAETKRFMKNIN
jgi:hypothetical protein